MPTPLPNGEAILEKSGKEPRKVATRQSDGTVQVHDSEDMDRVLVHAGASPVSLPNPELERARAKDDTENRQAEQQVRMGQREAWV